MASNQNRFQRSFYDFMKGNQGGFNGVFAGFPGGGGGGGPKSTGPDLPPYDPNAGGTGGTTAKNYWTFPQYTQTWAFTPPDPTPYANPNPFDTSKYGDPLNKKNVKKNV